MTSTARDSGTAPDHEELKPGSTRTSAAWTMFAISTLIVLLMVVFILQNSQRTEVTFLWFDGTVPVGAALLLAAVLGALAVLGIGAGRILQLRLMARRHRRSS